MNVIFNDYEDNILPKQKEVYDEYCKLIQWGRKHPTRFAEQFFKINLTDYQKYVILSSWVPKNVCWLCSRNTGKAQTLDSVVYPIVTEGRDGREKYPAPKRFGDLKVGDVIYGDDGKPTTIIHLNPIIFEETYEVEFDDGDVVECNGEHLWNVYDLSHDNRNYDRDKVITRNTDYLYTHFSDRFRKDGYNDYRFKVPMNGAIQYPSYDRMTVDPYVLGAYLGDGTKMTGDITSSLSDIEEMSEILSSFSVSVRWRKVEENKGLILIDKAKDLEGDLSISLGDAIEISLKKRLDNLGVTENKFIPDRYLYSSVENRLKLVQGLMDTDGSIDNNGYCEFCQKELS